MKILLIDDDPSPRKSFRLAPKTMGHQVTEASAGPRAEECYNPMANPRTTGGFVRGLATGISPSSAVF